MLSTMGGVDVALGIGAGADYGGGLGSVLGDQLVKRFTSACRSASICWAAV